METPPRKPSRRVGMLVMAGTVFAAAVPAIGQNGNPRELRNRLMLVSTRAIANFRAADPIEQRLHSEGHALHPRTAALRLRIEAALDETEVALKTNDYELAVDALDRAEAFLDRYARLIGGE